MSLLYKGYTIDFGAQNGRSERQRSVYRDCGCPYGRACLCERKGAEDLNQRPCGECSNCKKNKKRRRQTGRIGRLRCTDPPDQRGDWLRVRVGRSVVKLKREQLDFFRDKGAYIELSSIEEGNTAQTIESKEDYSTQGTSEAGSLPEGSAVTQIRSFASITWLQIRLIRAAHRSRAEELQQSLQEKQRELDSLQAELESFIEKKEMVQDDSVELFVDTLVAHGTWQRMSLSVAMKEAKKRIAALNENMRRDREELDDLNLSAWTVAVRVIQRCFRRRLAYKEELRRQAEAFAARKAHAATQLQRVHRGRCGRRHARQVKLDLHQTCTRLIQRVYRGHRGREEASLRRRQLARRRETRAASSIQSLWRSSVRKKEEKVEQEIRKVEEQKANLGGAATTIQRIMRGFLARKKRQTKRIELSLAPRVRELCNKFIAKGDLLHFLEAVNKDYEMHMAQQAELRRIEMENAMTFVNQVIAFREAELEKRWKEWEDQKLRMRPVAKAARKYDNSIRISRRTMFSNGSLSSSKSKQLQKKKKNNNNHNNDYISRALPMPGNPFAQNRDEAFLQQRERELLSPDRLGKTVTSLYSKSCTSSPPAKKNKGSPRKGTNLNKGRMEDVPVENMTSVLEIPALPRTIHDPKILHSPPAMVVVPETEPQALVAKSGVKDARYYKAIARDLTQLVFSDFTTLDDSVEKLVYCAVLMDAYRKETNVTQVLESDFQRFLLTAPAAVKAVAEEESWQLATAITCKLEDKGIVSCGDLVKHVDILDEPDMVPQGVSELLQQLVRRAASSIWNVRPQSVQKKWIEFTGDHTPPRTSVSASASLGSRFFPSLLEQSEEAANPRAKTAQDPTTSMCTVKEEENEVEEKSQMRPFSTATVAYGSDDETTQSTKEVSNAGLDATALLAFSDCLNLSRIDLHSSQSMRASNSQGDQSEDSARSSDSESSEDTVAWRVEQKEEEVMDDPLNSNVQVEKSELNNMLEMLRKPRTELRLEDPVHALFCYLAVEEYTFQSMSFQQFARHLVQVSKAEEDAESEMCKELLRERLSCASNAVRPFSTMLAEKGFTTIQSLSACPLQAYPIPEGLAARAMDEIKRLTFPTVYTASSFDGRYHRSATDIAAGNYNPLPPVKRTCTHQPWEPMVESQEKQQSRKKMTEKTGKDRLVNRLVGRANRLGGQFLLSEAETGTSMSYLDYKLAPKLGENMIIASANEVEALRSWHPHLLD